MSGITATYSDGDTFTVSGTDYTNDFNPGRRIKADCGVDGDKYGWVYNSTFDDPTNTVNLTDDSDAFTENLTEIWIGQIDVDHDYRFYNTSEVDTISGSINTKLDTHKSSADHDGRYYTEDEMDSSLAGKADTSHDHDGDTLQCDAINSDGGVFTLTTTSYISVPYGAIYLGEHNATDGVLVMYAADGLGGGTSHWYVSDNYNSTISRWTGQTYTDDFIIGPSNNTDAFKFKAEGDFYITNGSIRLEDNEYINFGGSGIGAAGFGIRDNAGAMEFKCEGGEWTTMSGVSGGGDVSSSSNITDNKLVRGDGGAKKIQECSTITVSDDGEMTNTGQPCFQVSPAAMTNIAVGTTTITFSTEVFDVGNNFNTGTYTFTAPVTGKYQFNINVRLETLDIGADYYQIRLETSNQSFRHQLMDPNFTGDLSYYHLAGGVLTDMDVNDTAYVTVVQNNGAAITDVSIYSWWSGALIC